MKQRALRHFRLACCCCAGCLPAQAQMFGPSDEEKAHEAGQDSQLSDPGRPEPAACRAASRRWKTRSRSLTESLAQATGTNEELRHQIDLLNQKIDQQQKDFSYRLCMVSAQHLARAPTTGPELRRRRHRRRPMRAARPARRDLHAGRAAAADRQ